MFTADSLFEPMQHRLDALNARLRLLRTSVLFSALSAEAHANELLALCLPPQDARALDRLSTPDKLLFLPRLVGHDDVLSRGGGEPHQTLVELFRTRNTLVHGKPGAVSGYVGLAGENDKDADLYGPEVAVRYLVAVARTAVELHVVRPKPSLYTLPFSDIWEHRAVLEHHLDATGRDLFEVPGRDDPLPTDLALAMERRRVASAKAQHSGRPDERTWNSGDPDAG